MIDVEQKIRDAITKSGLTKAEIARRSGIHRGVLSRFMRGERSLTLRTVSPLFDVLGLDIKTVKGRKSRK